MFKCTGICSECGRCKSQTFLRESNDRKTKMLYLPDDFNAVYGRGYGIAFDVGTTTVLGILWDFDKGELKQVKAATNPQNKYGLDVISRITFAIAKEGNLEILRNIILECMRGLIEDLVKKEGIELSQIRRVTICGNTAMSHIIAGYSPESLARAPFIPAYRGMLTFNNEQMDLNVNDSANIIILPGIAGHVGGDVSAGIVASRLFNENKLTVFIDIGTNGEIVLADGRQLLACSTAAGPAFEGAAIECGMRASKGAIEKVEIRDGDVFFKVIGDCKPTGICGSGLIDIVSEMLRSELIDKSGRLLSSEEALEKEIDSDLATRLKSDGRKRRFVLVHMENDEDIFLSQKDIREVQLANAAIKAGISLMLAEIGKTADDIGKIMVAGAFGNYIDILSAQNIGLLPKVNGGEVEIVGNAAGSGVLMALVSDEELARIINVANSVEHLELALCKDFQDVYLKAMSF